MTVPRKMLTLSKHARWRMVQRGITDDEINNALRTGDRESHGALVLHYDLRTWVGIMVDWRRMTVVTVLYLCQSHYKKLRESRQQNKAQR